MDCITKQNLGTNVALCITGTKEDCFRWHAFFYNHGATSTTEPSVLRDHESDTDKNGAIYFIVSKYKLLKAFVNSLRVKLPIEIEGATALAKLGEMAKAKLDAIPESDFLGYGQKKDVDNGADICEGTDTND